MTTLMIALLSFVAIVLGALIAGGVTLTVQLTKWHTNNQKLWGWNRQLVDHIYHGYGPPPPAPPPGLFE